MLMSKKRDLVLGFCPEGNGRSITPFDAVYQQSLDISKHPVTSCDAVVFWGGQDIHPSLYGESAHSKSQAFSHPTERDLFEKKTMVDCIANNIPIIGVCRGAQLMCAVAGGKLIQHVNGHNTGSHLVTTKQGEIFSVTSAHHQMMYPWDVPHELLAWSRDPLATYYQGEEDATVAGAKDHPEPEIVYFPTILGLAIQGHPEWANLNTRFVQYTLQLIKEKFLEMEDAPF